MLRATEMNLTEKRCCLFCREKIRSGQEVAVIANVLLAHEHCITEVRR